MCFLRVFGVVVFTVVMLFRMDWDVYMRGLEGWDMGIYYAYMYILPAIINFCKFSSKPKNRVC